MNVLSSLLNVAVKHGVFRFHPKCKKISLAHLCFVDDIFIFCHGSLESVLGVISILDRFYELSGLRLNAMKSELFACGVPWCSLDLICTATGFKNGQLPVRYLGVPLVTRKLSSKDCSTLLSRQLVLPKGVIRDIEKLCMRFFWKGCNTSARGARVSWSQLMMALCGLLGLKLIVSSLWIFGQLTIKGAWIWDQIRERRVKVDWHRLIWFPAHVLKFSIVAWMVILDRLPTKDILARFGIQVDNICGLCGIEQESRNHMFLECSFAREGKSLLVRILKIAWTGFVYILWEERNHRQFRGGYV
ncbi:uncharacterized protein LOC120118231 [Hibiscus syriacus]|uniref:uncharacterized protein LOC120118231 n=1 Tax=Hibiscus syriacus TaxID=106335 RepID=UPI00192272B8|nr:uncharacterized protein LOC120118231 [Hibiscus syriacus]